jgi:hypothetical protein
MNGRERRYTRRLWWLLVLAFPVARLALAMDWDLAAWILWGKAAPGLPGTFRPAVSGVQDHLVAAAVSVGHTLCDACLALGHPSSVLAAVTDSGPVPGNPLGVALAAGLAVLPAVVFAHGLATGAAPSHTGKGTFVALVLLSCVVSAAASFPMRVPGAAAAVLLVGPLAWAGLEARARILAAATGVWRTALGIGVPGLLLAVVAWEVFCFLS